jgi:hypothetical protein
MTKRTLLLLAIFASGCANVIPSQISYCEPIYARAEDWIVISDDLARAIYRNNMMCEELSKQ